MDKSLGTAAQPRIQNVTDQYLRTHQIYGSSDNTNPQYASSNKQLNYADGGSIQRPEVDRVSIIPYIIQYSDSVGLFGKENHFVRVNVDVDGSITLKCFSEAQWECAIITEGDFPEDNTYEQAIIDIEKDLTTVNTYEPAKVTRNSLVKKSNAFITIDLENLKTGNKYIDSWFDVRLYKSNREEHPFNKMYVRLNDFFYIGFHARNTKRLPYNVKCTVGSEYVSYDEIPEEERMMIAF